MELTFRGQVSHYPNSSQLRDGKRRACESIHYENVSAACESKTLASRVERATNGFMG